MKKLMVLIPTVMIVALMVASAVIATLGEGKSGTDNPSERTYANADGSIRFESARVQVDQSCNWLNSGADSNDVPIGVDVKVDSAIEVYSAGVAYVSIIRENNEATAATFYATFKDYLDGEWYHLIAPGDLICGDSPAFYSNGGEFWYIPVDGPDKFMGNVGEFFVDTHTATAGR